MRKSAFCSILRSSALLTLVGTVGYWLAMGAHRGWSQNRVPTTQTDEVTGIAFLGAGLALAAGLFAIGFLFHSPSSTNLKPSNP